jgi:hypothetical protein
MSMRRTVAAVLLVLLAVAGAGRAGDRKKDVVNLPGKATWDLRAFGISFRVVSTNYDAETKQVTWVLETKEGVRTGDFVRELDRDRPYVFKFLDADMEELATVRLGTEQFKGIPKDRIMKPGTRLEVVLDVPDVIGKTSRVVLQRGKGD